MGTYSQCVVDRDVSNENANEVAKNIIQWLSAEGIIQSELEHCVLSQKEFGYRPGKNSSLVTQGGEAVYESAVNGLELIIKREASINNQGDFESILCPNCNTKSPQDKTWSNAVTDWYEGGQGQLECVHCKHTTPVSEWEHIDPWGFGELTFKFWNWPSLSEAFINQLAEKLGHRTILICGKV